MNYKKWITANTESLEGKTVAITGSTGGLGKELCRHLAYLGANLVLVDRNPTRSASNRDALMSEFPDVSVMCIGMDLSDISSVATACETLKGMEIDVFIHNAGAYSIPRYTTDIGYDNVFVINFVSVYYIIRELMPTLRDRKGRVVIVGSIAHNYSHINESDVDFAQVKAASRVYGNAKRYLMFSLYELFKGEKDVSLAITHPGITFTNITAHYPKLIFALIKHPMKIIFMKPKKAALSILRGVFLNSEYHTWIGPRLFNVWGLPKKKKLKTCSVEESSKIDNISRQIYDNCKIFLKTRRH